MLTCVQQDIEERKWWISWSWSSMMSNPTSTYTEIISCLRSLQTLGSTIAWLWFSVDQKAIQHICHRWGTKVCCVQVKPGPTGPYGIYHFNVRAFYVEPFILNVHCCWEQINGLFTINRIWGADTLGYSVKLCSYVGPTGSRRNVLYGCIITVY